ncbi:hypothetical protein NN561_019629 [Cricetulus griseus]
MRAPGFPAVRVWEELGLEQTSGGGARGWGRDLDVIGRRLPVAWAPPPTCWCEWGRRPRGCRHASHEKCPNADGLGAVMASPSTARTFSVPTGPPSASRHLAGKLRAWECDRDDCAAARARGLSLGDGARGGASPRPRPDVWPRPGSGAAEARARAPIPWKRRLGLGRGARGGASPRPRPDVWPRPGSGAAEARARAPIPWKRRLGLGRGARGGASSRPRPCVWPRPRQRCVCG